MILDQHEMHRLRRQDELMMMSKDAMGSPMKYRFGPSHSTSLQVELELIGLGPGWDNNNEKAMARR